MPKLWQSTCNPHFDQRLLSLHPSQKAETHFPLLKSHFDHVHPEVSVHSVHCSCPHNERKLGTVFLILLPFPKRHSDNVVALCQVWLQHVIHIST